MGGSAALASVLVVIDQQVGTVVSSIAAAILVGYVGIEIAILSQPSTPTRTEVFYLVVGVVMIVLGVSGLG